MKKIFVILLGLSLVFTSCGTSLVMVKVQVTPGTEITTISGNRLGIVDNSGSCEIAINTDLAYSPFLLSKRPGDDVSIPFALDYKVNTSPYRFNSFMEGLGMAIAIPSLIVDIVGVVMLCVGDVEAAVPLFVGGSAGGLIGALGLGLPFGMRKSRDNVARSYEYVIEHTNDDLGPMIKATNK